MDDALLRRLKEAKFQCIDDHMEETAVDFDDAITMIEQQASRIAGLEASRIAYASEFPPDAEGLPDVGNIHANIRAMKRDAESWRAHMREVERVQDLERGGFGRDAALAQGEEG